MISIIMGFQTEFNWILKLSAENGLKEKIELNSVYTFSKEEYRIYPLNNPIDIINDRWEAVAKVVVLSFSNSDGKTTGKYKVLKIYEGEEKEVLTKYWQENVQYMKGHTNTNFSSVKLT